MSRPDAAAGAVDRVIRLSTTAAVVGVAAIAAYLSYEHAYVRAHGETGLSARLEPGHDRRALREPMGRVAG